MGRSERGTGGRFGVSVGCLVGWERERKEGGGGVFISLGPGFLSPCQYFVIVSLLYSLDFGFLVNEFLSIDDRSA